MIHLLMSETTGSNFVEEKFFKSVGTVPPSMAYIPSRTDPLRNYFTKFREHFLNMGVKDFRYCDFDQEFSSESWEILKDSSAVYLSGGFTPYFLETLRTRGALEVLREFSLTRPLIGVSAGAIIMGKDIKILDDSLSEGPATKALTSPLGLGIYQYDFYPHFQNGVDEVQRLTNRSMIQSRLIVACDDHSGLLIDGSNTKVIGKAFVFTEGKCQLVHDGSSAI